MTFICERIYCELKEPTVSTQLSLVRFDQAEIKPLGYFQTAIKIDNEKFSVKIYVVPNSAMTLDIIIRRYVLLQANIIIKDEMEISKEI